MAAGEHLVIAVATAQSSPSPRASASGLAALPKETTNTSYGVSAMPPIPISAQSAARRPIQAPAAVQALRTSAPSIAWPIGTGEGHAGRATDRAEQRRRVVPAQHRHRSRRADRGEGSVRMHRQHRRGKGARQPRRDLVGDGERLQQVGDARAGRLRLGQQRGQQIGAGMARRAAETLVQLAPGRGHAVRRRRRGAVGARRAGGEDARLRWRRWCAAAAPPRRRTCGSTAPASMAPRSSIRITAARRRTSCREHARGCARGPIRKPAHGVGRARARRVSSRRGCMVRTTPTGPVWRRARAAAPSNTIVADFRITARSTTFSVAGTFCSTMISAGAEASR